MTTESCKNGEIALPRVYVFGYVGQTTIFNWMLTTVCCLVAL